MRGRNAGMILAASAMCAAASPAQAQENAAALAEEVAALRAKLEAVEAKLAALEAAGKTAPAETKESKKDETSISWRGAPQLSTESGWSFKPRGRFQYDVGYVSSPRGISDPGLGFSNELRRARLGVEGTMPGGLGYKFEVDFADNEVET